MPITLAGMTCPKDNALLTQTTGTAMGARTVTVATVANKALYRVGKHVHLAFDSVVYRCPTCTSRWQFNGDGLFVRIL